MDASTVVMASVIVLASASFLLLLANGLREKEKSVAGFSRIDRSVGAKLELMASTIRKIILTSSALIVILTLFTAMLSISVISYESRAEGAYTIPEVTVKEGNLTMIRLVKAIPVGEIHELLEAILQHTTGQHKLVSLSLVETLTEPIRVKGVHCPKLLVVGISNCCDANYLISCGATEEAESPFVCVDERELERYLFINGTLPIIPIEAFIGNKPVYPPLSSIIITSLDKASQMLGHDRPAVNVVIIRGRLPTSVAEKILGEYAEEVWIVGRDGAQVLTSKPVASLKEVLLSALLSLTVGIVVSSASHSIVPRVTDLAEKLLISGFPSWGGTIIYYIVMVLCSVAAILAYSITALMASLPTSVGHIILIGTYALTSALYTPKTGVLEERGASAEDTIVADVSGCSINDMIEEIVAAIKRTEFFVIDELVIKRSGVNAFIRSKSIFSETWGIGVDIEVMITVTYEGSCRVEVRASDWSIEEISASLTGSVKRLALSRISSVIGL